MILPWFQACINCKMACYLTTSIAAIRFFYLSLFHGSTWSDPLCQGHCVYFTALIVNIHYRKRSVVDSRKREGCCVSLRKTIVTLLLKVFFAPIPFIDGECVNLTNSLLSPKSCSFRDFSSASVFFRCTVVF